jgi:hypothetical protein
MIFFYLEHTHVFADSSEDVKLIGIYSTKEKALAARERVADQPGFCDSPDGFSISEIQVDRDHWSEGFISADDA